MGEGAKKPWMKPLAHDADDTAKNRDDLGRLTQMGVWRFAMHREHNHEPGLPNVVTLEDSHIHRELVKVYTAEYHKRWGITHFAKEPNSAFRSAIAEAREKKIA